MSVSIIGGGPVGLSTAIQIKLKQPQTKIRIFERYNIYKRQHIVLLSPSSIKAMTAAPALKELYKRLRVHASIRTHDLENLLIKQARELGIEILYEQIKDPREIPLRFPDTRHVIGADGAHSLCRKSIFNDDLRFSKQLQHAIEVKYEVKGDTRRLPTEHILKLESRFGSFRPVEFIGRRKTETTPVTFWILVDKSTFDQMKEATFKTPYSLSQDRNKIPQTVLNAISNWMGARNSILGDIQSEIPEKISSLSLPSYASKWVTKNESNVQWSLVGDAAFGVPFYRSINNGMICSSLLAQAVVNDLKEHQKPANLQQKLTKQILHLVPSFLKGFDDNSSNAMKIYAIKQTWIAYKEYTLAFLKSYAITLLSYLLWLKRIMNDWISQMDVTPFTLPTSPAAQSQLNSQL